MASVDPTDPDAGHPRLTLVPSPVSRVSPPERLRADRLAALEMANATRLRRAEIHRAVKAGKLDPVALLRDPPDELIGERLGRFLRWVPKLGSVKVDKFLDDLGVTPKTTLRRLSPGKRALAARMLADLPVIRNRTP